MTPKEKAEELVIRMYGHTIGHKQAKNCALIAVAEVLREVSDNVSRLGWGLTDKEYWLQVKKEIELL